MDGVGGAPIRFAGGTTERRGTYIILCYVVRRGVGEHGSRVVRGGRRTDDRRNARADMFRFVLQCWGRDFGLFFAK